MSSRDACPECGAVVGAESACQELFEHVGLPSYEDYRYGRLHRLAVDAYALQHPARYCRSAKSLAAHLTGACAALEHPEEATELNATIQRWLSTNPPLDRPQPPASRGSRTIADVAQARDADEHERRVRAWAASAWAAWSEHQPVAREWIEHARRAVPAKVR